jgi:transaldolase
MKKKIDLYADGLTTEEFHENFNIDIDGYTFNPSIFKKLGATDYLEFSKKILKESKVKPISLEVFADDEKSMIEQAKILSSLAKNVYVKVPITFTDKKYTSKVIEKLVENNIKLNITAIFTYNQILEILPIIKNTNSILSVFVGRIFDCGIDAVDIMSQINEKVKSESQCKTLWASPRMAYDYLSAINCGTDIITMQASQIRKLSMFGKNLEEYSLDTVKQFYKDAKDSGFKL